MFIDSSIPLQKLGTLNFPDIKVTHYSANYPTDTITFSGKPKYTKHSKKAHTFQTKYLADSEKSQYDQHFQDARKKGSNTFTQSHRYALDQIQASRQSHTFNPGMRSRTTAEQALYDHHFKQARQLGSKTFTQSHDYASKQMRVKSPSNLSPLKSMSISVLPFPHRIPLLYLLWGDAAGAPIELLSAKQIKDKLKAGHLLLQEFVDFTAPKKDYTGHGYIYSFQRPGQPEPTDDSVVAFLSAKAAELESKNPEKIPAKFFELLKAEVERGRTNKYQPAGRGRQGFGPATINAIQSTKKGIHASNGGMPRVIGLAFHPTLQKNEAQLVKLSKEMVRLTHNSSEAENAAAAYALLLAKISTTKTTDQQNIKRIFKEIAGSGLITDDKVKGLFKENHYKAKPSNNLNNKGYSYPPGSALDALGLSTWILYKHLDNPNPEEALKDILHHGQDTDSNAALALAALGATSQSQTTRQIPKTIKSKLENWTWQ